MGQGVGTSKVVLGSVQEEATREIIMMRHVILALFALAAGLAILLVTAHSAHAATLRVPQDHNTIQAAIDASNPGDTITDAEGKQVGVVTSCSIDSDGYQLGQALIHEDANADGTAILVVTRGTGLPATVISRFPSKKK